MGQSAYATAIYAPEIATAAGSLLPATSLRHDGVRGPGCSCGTVCPPSGTRMLRGAKDNSVDDLL